MTLSEAVKKYGVRLDWLSGAIADAGILPKGTRKGLRKPANVYDEKEIFLTCFILVFGGSFTGIVYRGN